VTGTSGRGIDWTFVTTSLTRPTGGDIALFELVNAISRAGRDRVTLVHLPFFGTGVRNVGELSWFGFDGAIEHRFQASFEPDQLPDGDVLVYTMKLLASASDASAGTAGSALLQTLRNPPLRPRPSVLFLQGLNVFPAEVEALGLLLPGHKVCVGRWMVDALVARGVAPSDVTHIPNGVDPGTFRVTQPIAGRPRRAAMNFDPHPVKGGSAGLEALGLARQESCVAGTAFGTRLPEVPVPDGVAFVLSPSRSTIADEIYNTSAIFLQPSRREGFGMCAVEAMACGCALVTTANGGSDDYALDGETALVCGPEAGDMAEAITRLISDEKLRVRLAADGSRFVERFRWEVSAERLRQVVEASQ